MPETVEFVAPLPRLLDLAYSQAVPPAALTRMERAGKRLGLPLEALEDLGQDATVCAAFCEAVERDPRAVLRLFREGPLKQALQRRAHAEASSLLLALVRAAP